MIKKYESNMKVTQVCKEHEISRKTFYKWLNRYLALGKEGLLDQSHRPKRPHPKRLSISLVRLIKRIRKKTKYGPRRIKFILAKKHIKVSEYAIYMTLKRNKLILKPKNKRRKYKRVYVKDPGLDVQIDTKFLDTLPGKPYRFYQYTATDSATRMRVLRIYDDRSIYYSVMFLNEVINRFPFPVLAVRTDNGAEFTSGPFCKEHAFSKECVRLGIKHILNRPGYPQANGKCERSHRTDDEEFYRRYPVKDPKQWQYRLPKWEHEYNYQRQHQALNNLTPYQAWLKYKKESYNVT
jgi:transposase InsO family protein